MPRGLARIGLPAADDRIDRTRCNLNAVRPTTGALSGTERSAAARRGIEYWRATGRAVEYGICNMGDGFVLRMQTQKTAFLGLAPDAGDPRVGPDIGAV